MNQLADQVGNTRKLRQSAEFGLFDEDKGLRLLVFDSTENFTVVHDGPCFWGVHAELEVIERDNRRVSQLAVAAVFFNAHHGHQVLCRQSSMIVHAPPGASPRLSLGRRHGGGIVRAVVKADGHCQRQTNTHPVACILFGIGQVIPVDQQE